MAEFGPSALVIAVSPIEEEGDGDKYDPARHFPSRVMGMQDHYQAGDFDLQSMDVPKNDPVTAWKLPECEVQDY